jgi:hypothetical protein
MVFLDKIKESLTRNKLVLSINFNWLNLLVFTLFIVFPFMGLGTPSKDKITATSIISLVVYYLILVAVFFIPNKIKNVFDENLNVNTHDIYLFVFFLCLISLFNSKYLNSYLVGDELSYAGSSLRYPIKLLEFDISFLGTISVNDIMHITSFMMMLCALSLIRALKKFSQVSRCLSIVIISLVFHFLFFSFSGGVSGYSKINALPYTTTCSLFGVNPIVYRLTSACIISFVLVMICKFLAKAKFSRVITLVICVLFVTIPVEMFQSITIDHSIYFLVFAILPLLEIFYSNTARLERYIPLLVIGVYFRVTVGIVLIAYIVHSWNRFRQPNSFKYLLPVLLLVPYGIALLSSGPEVSNHQLQISSLSPEFMSNTLGSIFGSQYFYFTIVSLIYISIKLKVRVSLSIYIILSIFLFFVYLNSNLTGEVKYQQEWFSPLLILSLAYLSRSMLGIELKMLKVVSYILSFILIFSQLNDLSKFNYGDASAASFNVSSVTSVTHYPVAATYRYLELTQYKHSCFNAGVTYNLITEVFSGVNYEAYRKILSQREQIVRTQAARGIDWTTFNAEDLNFSGVPCVILGNLSNKEILAETLVGLGWTKLNILYDDIYSTNVIILVKPKS